MKKIILSIAGIFLIFGFSLKASAQTTGTLTFKFTSPMHASGNYRADGKYLVAVWIESCTPCGTTAGTSTFVKTKLKYGTTANNDITDHLGTWASKSGQSVVDATSGATTASIFTANTITWNGTNVAGTVVTDGSYRVAIQETWGHGSATVTRYFPFTKGTATDSQTPTADTNFTNISLIWAPTLGVEDIATKPDFVVYPNPSKGIFNIDFKNEVKNIKVANILGEVVYNEDIDSSLSGTTKKVDISSLANGIYIFNITNDKGTSSYKVLLEK